VKIVFTSAGNPATWTDFLKSKGITVVHVIANKKFALKAESCGADAIVAEGFEAGGHNGREETTTLCLIPLIADAVKIPVIAAGGIADGRSMMACMALGAEGVQIGSRFVATHESSAHDNFKQRVIHAEEGDTRLSLKKLTPVRLLKNSFSEAVALAESRGADAEELKQLLGRARAKKGMFEGDLDEGELEIGQIAATVREIKPAAEVVLEIWNDYLTTKNKICSAKH
jgi:enoyl-[acyl-carrier protein] reductase II